ncbi:MAG: response regulator, partial [Bacteroidales bacterium]|nr:response regulator [Bacteroidales bacterium]
RKLFSDYLFNKIDLETVPKGNRKKILVIDDEQSIVECITTFLKNTLPDFEIIPATSGREGLDLFKPNEFAVVLTDIVMPEIGGIELTERLTTADPDQVVLMLSGYYSEQAAKKFLISGGLFTLQKPFNLNDLLNVLGLAFAGGTPLAFKNKLKIICDEPGTFLFLLQEIFHNLNFIIRAVNDPNDVTHGLLRHKAKHIITDFVEHLKPGSDVINFMSSTCMQLKCIERISRPVGRVKVGEFETHLDHIIDDLRKTNSKINFKLKCSFPETTWDAIPFATVTVLIIFELIDNAISAIEGSGKIDVEIALLETTGMVNIIVRDNGPGISERLGKDVFKEGVTTTGIGRGLGLSLVREASRLFRGEVTYEYDNGATFRVRLFPFS